MFDPSLLRLGMPRVIRWLPLPYSSLLCLEVLKDYQYKWVSLSFRRGFAEISIEHLVEFSLNGTISGESAGGLALGGNVLKRIVQTLNLGAQPRPSMQIAMRLSATNFNRIVDPVETLFWFLETEKFLEEEMDHSKEEKVRIVGFYLMKILVVGVVDPTYQSLWDAVLEWPLLGAVACFHCGQFGHFRNKSPYLIHSSMGTIELDLEPQDPVFTLSSSVAVKGRVLPLNKVEHNLHRLIGVVVDVNDLQAKEDYLL
ncbi:hypothetical protein FNV43_RR15041 [Rhamnella rubrinervis]|uniref:Uncharacterized protein n=1 Tax=Rhamnella rubrinervis TaxID=2594499 RepID=A0A8K0GY89_9ROSA|nr:hypothetical protein FNV43_RR15041 [Rhamnella rubrinervis]